MTVSKKYQPLLDGIYDFVPPDFFRDEYTIDMGDGVCYNCEESTNQFNVTLDTFECVDCSEAKE